MGTLDHVTIAASDFAASLVFYDAVLGELGFGRVVELGDEEEDDAEVEVTGWGDEEHTVLWLVGGHEPTRGVHVCLRTGSRTRVEAFHAAALEAGGHSHDAPRRWPIYRRGLVNAIVIDPDGNLVEAVAPE
jgi:catechol 2,3-dioxygenase-like lactoylglutathione lyase family enzyme